jgi:hypothetical protein
MGDGMDSDETTAIGDASAAADAWLAHVEASWEATSTLFRRLVDLAQWRESFERVRSVFGRTLRREQRDARYATSVPTGSTW